MRQIGSRPARHAYVILAASVFVLVGFALATLHAWQWSEVQLQFSARSMAPGKLQVFHDGLGRFTEAKSEWIALDGQAWQAIAIPLHGADGARIRLDPPSTGAITVCGLTLAGPVAQSQAAIATSSDMVASSSAGCLQLSPVAGAPDPQLVLRMVDASAARSITAGHWRNVFFTLLLVTGLMLFTAGYALSRTAFGQRWMDAAEVRGARLDRNAHLVLIALMLLFGFGYLSITPPGAVADEEAHLSKIARVASGVPFGDSGTAPMPDVVRMLGPFRDYVHNKSSFTVQQIEQTATRPMRCELGNAALPRSANGYLPLPYLLPALIFRIGCAADAPFGVFLYLARLFNLLVGTTLVAWGVRHAVTGKWALFMVALLPMTMFQISSISVDALTLSLSLAWLGIVSGVAAQQLDPRRAGPWLLALALGIALSKPGSVWVLAALLFCKRAYDTAGVSFRAALVRLVLLPAIAHAAWTLHSAAGASVRDGVDAIANQNALIHAPFAWMHLLIATFSGENLLRLVRSMIGGLGWLDIVLPTWACWLGAFALLTTLGCNVVVASTRFRRPIALLLALASLMITSVPLYLHWTLPGAKVIEGLQGRYFTITVAFVLVWCAFQTPRKARIIMIALVLLAAPALNVVAIGQLYDGYFVSGRPG